MKQVAESGCWRLDRFEVNIRWNALCNFGEHTFVPISWACKKRTAVSHSSTEAAVILSDTCLRMEGLFALTLWDILIYVVDLPAIKQGVTHHVNSDPKHSKPCKLPLITFPPPIAFIFEDNECVIKMVIKGRSPHTASCVKNTSCCHGFACRETQVEFAHVCEVRSHQPTDRRLF